MEESAGMSGSRATYSLTKMERATMVRMSTSCSEVLPGTSLPPVYALPQNEGTFGQHGIEAVCKLMCFRDFCPLLRNGSQNTMQHLQFFGPILDHFL